jgi:glycosyltransferase 2 family protein
VFVGLTALGLAGALTGRGGALLGALAHLAVRPLLEAVALLAAYRIVNAGGWALVLRALRYPLGARTVVRVWVTSEALRWLPAGSGWGYGSRIVQAHRLGIPAATAGASVLLEMLLTVAAWSTVALAGAAMFRDPARGLVRSASGGAAVVLAVVAVGAAAAAAIGLPALGSPRLCGRLAEARARLLALCQTSCDWRRLASAFAYLVLMALVNCMIWALVLRATPGGTACPVRAAMAANALAWLAGFFAILAPGGLVVREACLAALLAAWVPAEQAVAAALAWRAVQVASEAVSFGAVMACGTGAAAHQRVSTPGGRP